MKWMLLTALSLTAFTAQGQNLNRLQCGYYTQESQEQEMRSELAEAVNQRAKIAASKFKEEAMKMGGDEFPALSLTLDHYQHVLIPAGEIALEGFDIQAKSDGKTAIQFMKKICLEPSTPLMQLMRQPYAQSYKNLMEELYKKLHD